jgi:hypothetical protein
MSTAGLAPRYSRGTGLFAERGGRVDGTSPFLPSDVADAADSVYATPWWFRLQRDACLDPGDQVEYHRIGGAVLPLRRSCRWRVRRLVSLTSHFTAEYRPLGEVGGVGDLVDFAQAALAGADLIRLDSLPYPSPLFACLEQALEAAGWLKQSWFHFGNWYLPTAGLDSTAYLAQRPSQLRRTVKRKLRAVIRAGGRFSLVTGGPELDPALAAYERVYYQSWKPPERYGDFIPELVRAAAARGALRLGLCHFGEAPAAAQIWLVWRGRATIFKLAYDERFRPCSPGTALTWWMMRHMLDQERVTEVDFGHGDDDYKRSWLPQRRERWGILGFNPHSVAGLALAARHIAGRSLKRRLLQLALLGRPLADPVRHGG